MHKKVVRLVVTFAPHPGARNLRTWIALFRLASARMQLDSSDPLDPEEKLSKLLYSKRRTNFAVDL